MTEYAAKHRRSRRKKGERAASDPPSLETAVDIDGWQPALSRKGGVRIKIRLTPEARRQLREVKARGLTPKVGKWSCDARSRDRLDPVTVHTIKGVPKKPKRRARSASTMSASARKSKLKRMGLA